MIHYLSQHHPKLYYMELCFKIFLTPLFKEALERQHGPADHQWMPLFLGERRAPK